MTNKPLLHPRSLHHGRYDFDALCACLPALSEFVICNEHGIVTIDFSNPDAILTLNQALLKFFYHIDFWQIPKGYLCPPIPGRADYIHYLADLLSSSTTLNVHSAQVKVLDIGCGANCIYPLLGSQIYNWSFVGVDIDTLAIKIANLLIKSNKVLNKKIKTRLQKQPKSIFNGIIQPQDKFTLSMCNPPFHASMEKALAGSTRKVNNLNKGKTNVPVKLNFAGQETELCCAGGEIAFLKQMVTESVQYAQQVLWFTSLVSKSENIAPLKKLLKQLNVPKVQVIKMQQGQKISRFIAWSFV
ncbi:23S rRNA mA1618 methyltransferase [Psychromonas sp. CNPT3]|uniref:23S rRNA (adenine(1618)-N(6))-methyltransferase RlmF n=1 Tax=Psychromonas sp. CNPT3 TaxID=314282 RepID=UPI00006E78DB|nr:23S rRNA (adenine(1618)-N(6))-methyltransferase RlmF [Psychromonas sp. CNPT3]AGH82094.1 23S rRNA mA1618 methyltransferase [Psychromonas sp. CNPT3]